MTTPKPLLFPSEQAPPCETSERCHVALVLRRKGLRLVPLSGKRPLVKKWPELCLDEQAIVAWSRCDVNWGVITGEPLIVIDTDSAEAEDWVQQQGIESPVMVRTGRGGLHRYFLQPEQHEIHSTQGLHRIQGLDVKGWRSFIVTAGSVHPETGHRYAYLPGKELQNLHQLPVFNPDWIRRNSTKSQNPRRNVHGKIRDVRRYARAIASLQGQGGDKACYTVACLLVEAGCHFDEALAEMEAWNEECAFPKWSREQLVHKIHYAFKRVVPGL